MVTCELLFVHTFQIQLLKLSRKQQTKELKTWKSLLTTHLRIQFVPSNELQSKLTFFLQTIEWKWLIKEGSPGYTLCKEAFGEKVDYLVLGDRGWGGLKRYVFYQSFYLFFLYFFCRGKPIPVFHFFSFFAFFLIRLFSKIFFLKFFYFFFF